MKGVLVLLREYRTDIDYLLNATTTCGLYLSTLNLAIGVTDLLVVTFCHM
jgi:hypothetical protein